ncbi:uncharacterized protein [Aegilops tauschii subsp. strangulata]|nr:B3 domain-containing protein Os06g0112300-like isoform X1 [Aegilops tauschii subsp. strangulata]
MAAASTEPALPGGSPADEDAEAVVASDELRHLPDQALQARLQRMQASIHGGIAARLPDGGRTYRRKLLAVRRELERRKGQAPALPATAPHSPSPLPSSQHPPPCQGGPPDDVGCKHIVESSDVQGTSSLPDQVKDEQMETPVCPSKQLPDAHIIKPKVEPCDDTLSPAPDASEDCETTPLSCSHPFFTIILSRSHVQKPFQLYIPGRFHKHLPEERTSATLICRGRSWAMRYCGDLKTKRLDADWMDFAVDNRLQVNDACVFELVTGTREEVVFQVQILRGGLPKDITSKGYTADEPLVIVG